MIVGEITAELGSDEHGFAIAGAVPSVEVSSVLPVNTLLEWWPDDEDEEFSRFIVKTGSQWGPFGVVLQVLDTDPDPVESHWEDVVEVSVEVAESVLISEIVDDDPVGAVAPSPGTYRMRVAATGRTESAARDAAFSDDKESAEEAIEHYLLMLWPVQSSAPVIVRQDSQYAADELSPPVRVAPPEEGPGREAAWAMVRDLRGDPGANPLPGALSSLVVEVEVAGTPTRVFNRVQHVFGWPTARGGSYWPDPMATGYSDATLPEFDGPYEQVGHIATTPVELDKPKRFVLRWNWVLDAPGPLTSRPLLLAEDSIVTVNLERLSAGDDAKVLVRLEQVGIPAVWVEHLEKLWVWHITLMASR